MLNPFRRALRLPGELGAGLITGTEKIRSGFGNGDCLLLDFRHRIFAVADAAVFVNLGMWQLRRHDERALENSVRAARLESAPVALGLLLDSVGEDLASLEFRRTEVTGEFRTADEVLLRGQAFGGSPGFHIVTLLTLLRGPQ